MDDIFETVVLPLTGQEIIQIEETVRTGFMTYEEILLRLVRWELMDELLNVCEGDHDLQIDITLAGKLRVS
jgi:hypothetical protein